MNENQSVQEFQKLEPNFNQGSRSNLNSNQDSNQIENQSNQNLFTAEFPLSRTAVAKLLNKSDVAVGKWLTRLSEVYVGNPNQKLKLLENNKITEWGFNQLVALQRATSPEIPDYDPETGKIFWNENGNPVKMVENSERVSLNKYLSDIQSDLLTNHTEAIASISGLEPAKIVPVEIDTAKVINMAQINQLEAGEAMNRTLEILNQSQSRYSTMRAMRRRNIAAQALRDSAEDAELYAKVYDANLSKMVSQQANGLEGEDNDG